MSDCVKRGEVRAALEEVDEATVSMDAVLDVFEGYLSCHGEAALAPQALAIAEALHERLRKVANASARAWRAVGGEAAPCIRDPD